tara:strand:+ start:184 stop:1449 length:1266 start_codon:yes stop_codon:yes gene_type:complete
MNDAFKKYETGKASKSEDYYGDEMDDEGNKVKLTGNALKSAKNNAMADVYDKYGDVEGAMKMRTGNEKLQGLMRDNRIGTATEASRIQVEGVGAVNAQNAGIGASLAATGASTASTRLSNLQSDAAQLAVTRDTEMNSIFTSVGEQEFENDEDETAFLIDALSKSNLPPDMRNQALIATQQFGSTGLAMESDRLVNLAGKAMQGGVSSFEKFYNNEISDGGTLDIVQEDGNTVAYVITGEGEGQTREVLFTGKGETGQMEVLNSLYQSVKSPGEILEASVQNLALRQGEATVDKTEAETTLLGSRKLSEMSQQEVDTAQKGFIEQKTAEIKAKINEMDGLGLGAQQEIALEGMAALQRSAEFIALSQQGEAGAVMQAEILAGYRENMGLNAKGGEGSGPPAGISAGVWAVMSDEDKALFAK